jgi:fructose-bisphosphate aldolase class II
MAFVKVSDILKMADKAHTSAMAFNCVDFNTAHSVIMAAEKLQKPVIVMLYPGHCTDSRWTTPAAFAPMVISEANKVSVPVALHMDHSSDFEYIKAAIDCGFTSVMYDGSMLPVEENLKNTKMVVDYAHAKGVEVEAELGWVGFADNEKDQSNTDMYTSPETAKRFCDETGCDSVAVAIGSAHGYYNKTPKLDLDRLQQINAATDTPLVLHGGSGIPDDQLEKAFTMGINKFNVGTEFLGLYFKTVVEYAEANKHDPKHIILDMAIPVQDALMAYLHQKMQLSKM